MTSRSAAHVEKKSLCRICTAQCPIVVEIDAEGRPVSARGDKQNPHSEGFFCLKGKHFPEMHTTPGRLRHSLARDAGGEQRPIEVERALDEIAVRLQAILDRHGPDSVAVYTGTLFYQLPQTAAMATAWMDALRLRLRFSSGTIDQPGKQIAAAAHGVWLGGSHVFDESDVWMLVGTNPLVAISGGIPHANPARRLERARARGLELIVIDPRRSETAKRATLHLQPRPGTDPAILAGILREVITTGRFDRDFVRENVAGFERLAQAVEPFTAERVAVRADVSADAIREAAQRFASARKGSVTAGTGANMSGWSNLTEYLVLCLNSICGRFRRAGDRVANPGVLTTQRAFKAQAIPPYKVEGYGKPLRSRPDMPPAVCGLPTSALADEILLEGEDRVRALFTIGGNPMRAWPDPVRTQAALERLELHVVVDPRPTDTARLADYVLAPLLPLETPGSTLSTENLFTVSPALGYSEPYGQYAPPIVAPPPGSDLREDWAFFFGLAQRMGLALELSPGVFPIPGVRMPKTKLDMRETPTGEAVLELVTRGSRIPLERLRREPDRVLFDDEPSVFVEPRDPDDTARLDVGSALLLDELAVFDAGDPHARAGYAYRMVNRRMANTFNSLGTDLDALTARYGTNPAFLHPDDLAREGLARGDLVRLRSPHGELEAVAWPDPDLRPGLVSMCHCWGAPPGEAADVRKTGSNVGLLISVEEDCARFSGIPLMSAIPVRLVRA
ncbi:MAG: molybdopterin-dependent oxidoreductase [Deltaproteobacteria bacterium]|nr:molybdopterin-dependent oxidoreductase [Deltaproteobacteria bacterium]